MSTWADVASQIPETRTPSPQPKKVAPKKKKEEVAAKKPEKVVVKPQPKKVAQKTNNNRRGPVFQERKSMCQFIMQDLKEEFIYVKNLAIEMNDEALKDLNDRERKYEERYRNMRQAKMNKKNNKNRKNDVPEKMIRKRSVEVDEEGFTSVKIITTDQKGKVQDPVRRNSNNNNSRPAPKKKETKRSIANQVYQNNPFGAVMTNKNFETKDSLRAREVIKKGNATRKQKKKLSEMPREAKQQPTLNMPKKNKKKNQKKNVKPEPVVRKNNNKRRNNNNNKNKQGGGNKNKNKKREETQTSAHNRKNDEIVRKRKRAEQEYKRKQDEKLKSKSKGTNKNLITKIKKHQRDKQKEWYETETAQYALIGVAGLAVIIIYSIIFY